MSGIRRNWFPIALAILWIAMAAMAMVDFASFAATTRPQKTVATEEKPLHSCETAMKTRAGIGPPLSMKD